MLNLILKNNNNIEYVCVCVLARACVFLYIRFIIIMEHIIWLKHSMYTLLVLLQEYLDNLYVVIIKVFLKIDLKKMNRCIINPTLCEFKVGLII